MTNTNTSQLVLALGLGVVVGAHSRRFHLFLFQNTRLDQELVHTQTMWSTKRKQQLDMIATTPNLAPSAVAVRNNERALESDHFVVDVSLQVSPERSVRREVRQRSLRGWQLDDPDHTSVLQLSLMDRLGLKVDSGLLRHRLNCWITGKIKLPEAHFCVTRLERWL